MSISLQYPNADGAFQTALKRGKRDTSLLSRLFGHDNRILLLSQVLEAINAVNEAYVGIQEVPVQAIIGSENRGEDFSREFHPRKSWMAPRWIAVYNLLFNQRLNETVSLIEIGGCYFVRDGHHRVSAAKSLGILFLTAEVRSYPLEYRITDYVERNQLPLLRAKERFHRNTGVFRYIPDSEFSVACPHTWEWLEKEICDYNRSYFIRRFGREPANTREQVDRWYENLYRNAIDYIRNNSLSYLFPGKLATDIFVDMIRFWNTHDCPDSLWVGEIYQLFVAEQRKRAPLRIAVQIVAGWMNSLLMSPEDEYRLFVRVSKIDQVVPEFDPLPNESGIYRYLHNQFLHCAAQVVKQEINRAPYIHELTQEWYTRFYKPVAAAARNRRSESAQVRFYRRFSKQWFDQIMSGEVRVDDALQR